MKKFIFSTCLLLMFSNYSNAQEITFKVIKPLSVVRNAALYGGEVTGKIFDGVKTIIKAPFTRAPSLEVRKFRYTMPKLRWQRGKLQRVEDLPPPPDTGTELLDLPEVPASKNMV